MNTDLEAAGAPVTAGMVTNESGGGPRRGHAAHPVHGARADAACRNCAAPLHGTYCQTCGQPAHIHRSLLHLGEEVLHGLLHFDAKGWRTLRLLVARPGQLTRRYIDGQRTRFVSPLALFLFMVFLMFFVVSLTSSAPTLSAAGSAADRDEVVENVREADAAVARSEAEVAHARKTSGDAAEAESDFADARAEQRAARLALEAFDAAARAAAASAASTASGAFLGLMFVGQRGVTLYDHAVFGL